MLKSCALVLVVLGSACADDAYDGARVGGRTVEKEVCPTGCNDDVARAIATSEFFNQVSFNAFVTGPPQTLASANDACNMLPADGLCPYACERDEIAARIALGSCVNFTCALADGRTIVAGACANDWVDNNLSPN
jgi:hypothetical protein